VNGANAAIIVKIGSELPAYQGFSGGRCTVASPEVVAGSMASGPPLAKLKKMLAGHGVSGVS
jgi:hypothetical protein